MDENDPLIERLRGLGRGAIDPGVAARHLGGMAGVRTRSPRLVKLKVGTAFAAGLILGGTGLASAGALPAPVQHVAHGALTQVGVSVPSGHSGHGPARYNGPECTGGPYANHGQYVRTHKSDPNAGKSRCGKPVQAGKDETTNGTEAPEAPESQEKDKGGPGAAHAGHGPNGKPKTTPSTAVTVPAPLEPSTTVAPSHRGVSTPTSRSTTTVKSTATSTSSTSAPTR